MKKLTDYLTKIWNFIRFSPGMAVGIAIFLVLFVLGFVVSLFVPANSLIFNSAASSLPPSLAHLFGTTVGGQDVFWMLTLAIKNSIILGVVASGFGLIVGTILGLIAGYKGGMVEKVILLASDTFIVLPGLPILLLISILLKGDLSPFLLGSMIAFITWGLPVRAIRSMILSLREREFTYTSVYSGYKTVNLVFSEYLPHVLPWAITSFIARINLAIGLEVSLAVFGLISLSDVTIGTMVYWVTSYQALLRGMWWWFFAPVVAVVLTVVSLYLLSNGLSDYLDPKWRLRK